MADNKLGNTDQNKKYQRFGAVFSSARNLRSALSQGIKNINENSVVKEKLVNASDAWMEKNRSLVLRQTPICHIIDG